MATISAAAGSALGQDQFLQLLVAQVQNQNPLEPVSDTEFIAQLAQFNSLSNLQQLNANFSQMLQLQQLTQGTDLLGRNVEFRRADGTGGTGLVNRVITENGRIVMETSAGRVGLDEVISVTA